MTALWFEIAALLLYLTWAYFKDEGVQQEPKWWRAQHGLGFLFGGFFFSGMHPLAVPQTGLGL